MFNLLNIIRSNQNRIYELRGERVMLDFDLAAFYEIETRVLNQSVRRNRKRFPEDFMFQLTKEEFESIKFPTEALQQSMSSQIVMTYSNKRPSKANLTPLQSKALPCSAVSSIPIKQSI
jgi:hypothetical protein